MCTNVISRVPGSAGSAEEMEEFSAPYYKKHSIEFSRNLKITMGDFRLKGRLISEVRLNGLQKFVLFVCNPDLNKNKGHVEIEYKENYKKKKKIFWLCS